MTYLLRLEAIGDDDVGHNRLWQGIAREAGLSFEVRRRLDTGANARAPWVAEVVATDPRWGFRRRFVHGQKDYSEANSIGSRGVYIYYALEIGRVYDIHERTSWRGVDRRYALIVGQGERRMTEDEVRSWLARGD